MSESSDATPSDVAVASPPPRRHRWTVGRPLLEVVLIALGVFLGLAAEQWRDRSERQERATETLRRIRAEMVANREAVRRVVGYHANALVQLKSFLSTPVPERDEKALRMEGIQSAQFESTPGSWHRRRRRWSTSTPICRFHWPAFTAYRRSIKA
jgi:hypothetical protein